MIHRFWHGDHRPLVEWSRLAVATTQNEMPVDWSFENLPRDIRNHLDPDDDPRHISNLVRYGLLFDRGGLWLDHDVIPLERLPRPAEPYTAGLTGRHVACVMWFPRPGHPLLRDLILEGRRRLSGTAPERSGGRLLNELVVHYPDVSIESGLLPFDRDGHRVGQEHPKAIHLWEGSFRATHPEAP